MAPFQKYRPEIIPTSRCPLCDGSLRVRDFVKRFVRISSDEKYGVTIRRLICDVCGKIHRELPDFLLPHKHYPTECIEAEIEQRQMDENAVCAYPELSTCFRWRQEFHLPRVQIEQQHIVTPPMGVHLCYDYDGIHMEWEKAGIGWLAECIRTAVNTGLVFRTEFAFPTKAISGNMKAPKACICMECLLEWKKNGGYETMQKTETSIVKWLLLEIRRVHFQDSMAFMASALGFPQKTLQSALNNAGGQRIVDVFEETMRYCVRNQLGLDAMLMRYPGAQKKD